MEGVASTGRTDKLPASQDGAHSPRTWATGPEVCELVKLAHIRDNPTTRFHCQVANHCADLYDVLRKRAATGRPIDADRHAITYGQLGADLYDDCDPRSIEDAQRKRVSLGRWLARLQAAGLIEYGVRTIGTGKNVGLWYRLLPVPALPSTAPAGVAQSVRAAES